MAINRGKQFEGVIKDAFEKVEGVSIDRLLDPMAGYAGVRNICDFIVYKKPYEYYLECKTTHAGVLPFSQITANQWRGLLEKSKIEGVVAGIICWWIGKGVTKFIPAQALDLLKNQCGDKSVKYDLLSVTDLKTGIVYPIIDLGGRQKRVLFEYDLENFFKQIEETEILL